MREKRPYGEGRTEVLFNTRWTPAEAEIIRAACAHVTRREVILAGANAVLTEVEKRKKDAK